MSENELVERYAGFAVSIAKEFFIQGGDWEDVRQEALIGLLKGIRDYRPEKGSPDPRNFYGLCVRRHLVTESIRAGRLKHVPLTQAMRHGVNEYGQPVPILDLLGDECQDPAAILESRDLRRRLELVIAEGLSPHERTAVEGYRDGLSYAEIAGSDDGRKPKWVDNALQRARRKLVLEVAA